MNGLVGKLVRLRPLALADMAFTLRWRNDPAIRDAQLGYRLPVTEAMERRWYADKMAEGNASHLCLTVEALDDGGMVGMVQIMDLDRVAGVGRFGITIGERPGHGFGGEATALLIGHAFSTLGLRRLWLYVRDDNLPALRLYRRLGFAEEGLLRRHALIDGRAIDVRVMGLLAGEWEDCRP